MSISFLDMRYAFTKNRVSVFLYKMTEVVKDHLVTITIRLDVAIFVSLKPPFPIFQFE